jgi:predicted aspartyl protease
MKARTLATAALATTALVNLTACSNPNNQATSFPNQQVTLVSTSVQAVEPPAPPKQAATSLQVQPPQPSLARDTYQQAIDLATGAMTISQSAVSREDWSLVANRWQTAINSLKAVTSKSPHYQTAQKKLSQYLPYLAEAKLRATPPPAKSCSSDTNPAFFSIPIKGRVGGTPIVEIMFNDNQKFDMLFDTGATHTLITWSMAAALKVPAIGMGSGRIADGSVVLLPIALVKSQGIDGRFRVNVPVAVAPPAMPIGLLGQDFSNGYDITIKQDVIEFRRQSTHRYFKRLSTTCLVDTSPKFFSVPITGRRKDVPIVEVSFNGKYRESMLFDTGASGTVITHNMAVKMGLSPIGINQAQIADGSVVNFATAVVKSFQIAGRIKRDMEVSVAPPASDIGLLGQDFFEGYDFTIKKNVIEFHRQDP